MEITFLGHSCFKIRGKSTTLITDPFSSAFVGLKFPKTPADIVTISHQHEDHNNLSGIEGNPFVIDNPGEYEVKGVSVFGFPSFHDANYGEQRGGNTIYVMKIDGVRICHLGDLGTVLSTKQVEEVNGIDVLLIPVGGVFTIGPKQAVEIINQVEPKVVLPMHYKAKNIDEKNFGKLVTVDEFLEQLGVANPQRLDKLSLNKEKLPQEMQVVVLELKS